MAAVEACLDQSIIGRPRSLFRSPVSLARSAPSESLYSAFRLSPLACVSYKPLHMVSSWVLLHKSVRIFARKADDLPSMPGLRTSYTSESDIDPDTRQSRYGRMAPMELLSTADTLTVCAGSSQVIESMQ
jgi:hypothetical protein